MTASKYVTNTLPQCMWGSLRLAPTIINNKHYTLSCYDLILTCTYEWPGEHRKESFHQKLQGYACAHLNVSATSSINFPIASPDPHIVTLSSLNKNTSRDEMRQNLCVLAIAYLKLVLVESRHQKPKNISFTTNRNWSSN